MNGVAVERNRQAFLWGRRYQQDPLRVLREAGIEDSAPTSPSEPDLDTLLASRHDQLTAYQNRAYAERYLTLVERVREREASLGPRLDGDALPLTRAVAEAYHKLLAYKDEYEVARLYTNGDFEKALAEQFEGDYRLRFHLAPTWLSKPDPLTGRPRKREFGAWLLPVLRLVAGLRPLRGGALDLFGYSAERRQERALIKQYEQDIDALLDQLDASRLDHAVALARLPLEMRGFGPVKDANIAGARQKRERLLRLLSGQDIAVELFSA